MAVKVKISDSVSTTSSEIAASSTAVKAAYDLAASKQANLGFTPVQQGGGTGQSSNKIYLGWAGSALKCTVDSTDIGYLVRSVNGTVASSNGNIAISTFSPKSETGVGQWTGIYATTSGFPIPSGGTWAVYYGGELFNSYSRYGGAAIVSGGTNWKPGAWENVHSMVPSCALCLRIA